MDAENKVAEASPEHYQKVVNIMAGKIGMLTTENVSKTVAIVELENKVAEYEQILEGFKGKAVDKT